MKYFIEYPIFFSYLDSIWEITKNPSLGALLGGMSLLEDGTPADSAIEDDWRNAISVVTSNRTANAAVYDLAYWAGIAFLKQWLSVGYDPDIERVCDDLQTRKYPQEWEAAVNQTMEGKADLTLHLEK